MSPRPYSLGHRREAADATYAQIIAAARELLAADEGAGNFTIDAVARQANVARMTVYNRFKSKRGLLEAVFDDLAAHGRMMQVPDIFSERDPLAALDRLVAVFGQFWDSDRIVIRRIRALGTLDKDIGEALRARDESRSHLVQVVLSRVAVEHDRPEPQMFGESVKIIQTLTGFEFFDALAGPDHSPLDVVPIVQKLAQGALGMTQRSNQKSKPEPKNESS